MKTAILILISLFLSFQTQATSNIIVKMGKGKVKIYFFSDGISKYSYDLYNAGLLVKLLNDYVNTHYDTAQIPNIAIHTSHIRYVDSTILGLGYDTIQVFESEPKILALSIQYKTTYWHKPSELLKLIDFGLQNLELIKKTQKEYKADRTRFMSIDSAKIADILLKPKDFPILKEKYLTPDYYLQNDSLFLVNADVFIPQLRFVIDYKKLGKLIFITDSTVCFQQGNYVSPVHILPLYRTRLYFPYYYYSTDRIEGEEYLLQSDSSRLLFAIDDYSSNDSLKLFAYYPHHDLLLNTHKRFSEEELSKIKAEQNPRFSYFQMAGIGVGVMLFVFLLIYIWQEYQRKR